MLSDTIKTNIQDIHIMVLFFIIVEITSPSIIIKPINIIFLPAKAANPFLSLIFSGLYPAIRYNFLIVPTRPSIRKPPKFLADKFYAISLIILEIISSMSIGCLLLQNV